MEAVSLSAFACEFGDRERTAESIADFSTLCQSKGLGLSLSAMGCKSFWQMTRPVESYVVQCIARTITASGVAADQVDHVIFTTMDKNLRHLDVNFARDVLAEAGLVQCVPIFLSMQQCVSSLGAVDHAARLLADGSARHVVVAAFDFVPDDADRIQSFALFGDAVTTCMVSRAPGLALLARGVGVDFTGLMGRDNFESRKQVVLAIMKRILDESGARIEDVERCFTTNFYKPIAWFNASVAGIQRARLGTDTLATRAHCGNCDWMMNLAHQQAQSGLTPGRKYLVQSFAPGFFAAALLEPR
jgi:3-oxoacyl-[acyl-carrier-protein] synthase III